MAYYRYAKRCTCDWLRAMKLAEKLATESPLSHAVYMYLQAAFLYMVAFTPPPLRAANITLLTRSSSNSNVSSGASANNSLEAPHAATTHLPMSLPLPALSTSTSMQVPTMASSSLLTIASESQPSNANHSTEAQVPCHLLPDVPPIPDASYTSSSLDGAQCATAASEVEITEVAKPATCSSKSLDEHEQEYQHIEFEDCMHFSDQELATYRELIASLCTRIPTQTLRIAGKSIPSEKFAVRRAQQFLERKHSMVLPGIEVLYLFPSFQILNTRPDLLENLLDYVEPVAQQLMPLASQATRSASAGDSHKGAKSAKSRASSKRLDPELQAKIPNWFWDEYALTMLLKGACLRMIGRRLQARICFDEVIGARDRIRTDMHVLPLAHLERALLILDECEPALCSSEPTPGSATATREVSAAAPASSVLPGIGLVTSIASTASRTLFGSRTPTPTHSKTEISPLSSPSSLKPEELESKLQAAESELKSAMDKYTHYSFESRVQMRIRNVQSRIAALRSGPLPSVQNNSDEDLRFDEPTPFAAAEQTEGPDGALADHPDGGGSGSDSEFVDAVGEGESESESESEPEEVPRSGAQGANGNSLKQEVNSVDKINTISQI